MKQVLVLGGGPDDEREVSLNSAAGVAEALRQSGRCGVIAQTIDRVSLGELRAMPGDVVFPVLHGAFGEGFHTTLSPHTAAIIAFQAHTATGKLNAVITATGPSGCHCSYMRCAGRSECIDRP